MVDDHGNVVEVQFLTRQREAVSFLDHDFLYKQLLSFSVSFQEQWLKTLSAKANMFEVERVKLHMGNCEENEFASLLLPNLTPNQQSESLNLQRNH